jgi:RNA polymerase sigma-70 factor (ECF subfamily)
MVANSVARSPSAQPNPEPSPPETTATGVPSFATVYRSYFHFVWSSAKALGVSPGAVDDVVQEVFVTIHARLHTVQQPESLRSWVYGVVRRTVSGYRRSRAAKTVDAETVFVEDSFESNAPTPFQHVEQTDEMQLLAQLLNVLDDAKREVFVLAELEEMTVPEIAEMLEIPLNTVYSRLRTARQLFEQAFARHNAREKRGTP